MRPGKGDATLPLDPMRAPTLRVLALRPKTAQVGELAGKTRPSVAQTRSRPPMLASLCEGEGKSRARSKATSNPTTARLWRGSKVVKKCAVLIQGAKIKGLSCMYINFLF